MQISTADLVNKIFAFCETLAGTTLRPYQAVLAKRIIRSVVAGEGAEITALYARQCIRKGSMINTRDGEVKRIEEEKNAWKTSDDKECLHIHVKGGYNLYATSEHPVYTKRGWVLVGDLKPNDYVACLDSWDKFGDGNVPYSFTRHCGRRLDTHEGTRVMNDELAEFLGWITTDGSFGREQSPKFTNNNVQYIERVKYLTEKLFPDVKTKLYEKGNGWDLLMTTDSKGRENPIGNFLREMDFDKEAEFPRALNYFTRSQLISYFRSAFACDGYVHIKKDRKNIEIGGLGSSNEYAYAEFHRELLNKLGISGCIKSEIMNKNKNGKKFNRIIVSGQRNARLFKEIIGDVLGKEIPDSLFDNYTRENAIELFNEVDGEVLQFKQITSIQSAGNYEVWDLQVPDKGWFICDGVKVHNSGKSYTVAVIMCGISIILPILANMPMFMNDRRLKTFQQGFLLGIFAPVKGQAQLIFGTIKSFLGSDNACKILSDPEINVSFEISNGENLTMKFKNYDVKSKITCMTASEGSNIEGHSYMVIVCDEAQDIADIMYKKSIFPMGSAYNSTNVLIGTPNTKQGFFYETIQHNKLDYANGLINKSHFEYDWHEVVKYNPLYEKTIKKEIRKHGSEEDDYFQMSYCLKWLLSRGMFITSEKLDFLGNENLEAVDEDKSVVHVAGIDLGKTKDSTVVTIGEVDWENPVVIEESKDANVPDYVAYDVTVKSWLEIQGDDWNAQYDKILSFLRRFSIAKVVIDATGVGSSIFDRLNAELSREGIECIAFTFSRPAKSSLFKNFDSQIKAGRFHYPAGELTRETMVFKHFKEQMGMLEKSYSGTDMVCAAPNTRTAHDDYPVSAALCVWGAKGESRGIMETSNVSIYKASSKLKNRYAGRNKYSRRGW